MADSRCPSCGRLGYGPLPCPWCDTTRDKPTRILAALALAVGLSGCAVLGRGEQPTDIRIGGLSWYIDRPEFVMSERARGRYEVRWNVVEQDRSVAWWLRKADAMTRLRNLCGYDDPEWDRLACTLRITERAQCVVYSILTPEQAELYTINHGQDSVYRHELRHCGIGMPVAAGWKHRED